MGGWKHGAGCTSCPQGNAEYNTIDYGFTCRGDGGTLFCHYNNHHAHQACGSYTSSTVLEVRVDGSTVTWLADGLTKMTKAVDSSDYPMHVYGTIYTVQDPSIY